MLTEITDNIEAAPSSAFLTDNPIEILQFAQKSFLSGSPVALVTLVDVQGGAARSLGAQMVVRSDGLYCGFVSGGCTETAVAAEAVDALRVGHDRYLLLGEGSPFFDIVLPCGGGLRLAIHVLRNVECITRVLSRIYSRCSASIHYDPYTQTISFQESSGYIGWSEQIFAVVYHPPVRILVAGRSFEAKMTTRIAQAAGYDVEGIENGSCGADVLNQIDAHSAVVLLFHDLESELPILRAALDSSPFYIGALGSHKTHEKRSAKLRDLGYSNAKISRIKAPIGIFEKAKDASSIALSVVAEIAAQHSSKIKLFL